MELHWLRDIAQTEGPFATVHLDVTRGTPDAAHATRLRWSDLRGELERDGADPGTLTALDGAVDALVAADNEDADDEDAGAPGHLLVARAGEIVLDTPLPVAPERSHARWSALPDLVPALTVLPERLATVVAVVDAEGVDIYCGRHPERLEAPDERERTGTGPLHKVRAGGLAHLSIQRHVEEHQRASAERAAEAIDAQVARTGAGLLVLAGEVQARSRVRRALTGRAAKVVEEVDVGGRAAGSDDAELARAVSGLVNARIAERRRAEAERFERASGRHEGTAVDGVAEVAAAFRSAQVDTLYLDAGALPDAAVWVGPAPEQVAARPEDLDQLGVPATGPVDPSAALVRAAAGTGAAFVPVGGGRTALAGRAMADGVGAVLRV